MNTEVIMKRELFGYEIQQKSKSGFFSATDLVRIGNQWRGTNGLAMFDFKAWRQSQSTKDFISELERSSGVAIISGSGRGHHTWVHPYLFIDIALAINPKLKVEVYGWILDSLLKFRNDSGDTFKLMAGSLYDNTTKKTQFPKAMIMLSKMIKEEVGACDWQNATESQLEYRDKIHEYISLMCGIFKNNNNEAVRIGIIKAKEWKNSKDNLLIQ